MRGLPDLDAAGLRRACHQLKAAHCTPVPPPPPGNSFGYRLGEDGALTGRIRLDPEASMLLRTAIDGLARPRPAHDGITDTRGAAQRTGDALAELARLALTEAKLPAHGGSRPTLLLTIPLADLRGPGPTGPGGCAGPRPRPIRLDRPDTTAGGDELLDQPPPEDPERPIRQLDGTELSVATLRRYACNATLIPAILTADGVPLDLGRTRRTANPYQRKALALRDRGCAWPGCHQPGARCEAHHLIAWWAGGSTDLDNMALLCGHHHKASHDTGWTIFIDEETRRHRFDPPRWWTPPDTRAA